MISDAEEKGLITPGKVKKMAELLYHYENLGCHVFTLYIDRLYICHMLN